MTAIDGSVGVELFVTKEGKKKREKRGREYVCVCEVV